METDLGDRGNFPTDDADACRARVEAELRRRCQAEPSRGDIWTQLSLQFFDRGNHQYASYTADCAALIAGEGLCAGDGCPRPCPPSQCLFEGEEDHRSGPEFCTLCK
jgi:hypothetical protein